MAEEMLYIAKKGDDMIIMRRIFVYLLSLFMMFTLISVSVSAEETDIPTLSTGEFTIENSTETESATSSDNTDLLKTMKQSVDETEKTDTSNEGDSTDNIFGVSTNDLLKMMDSTLNGESDLSLSDAINSLSQSQGTGWQIDTKNLFSDFSVSDLSLGNFDTDINFGDLNLKYMQAAGAAEKSYNSEDLSGKSLNCKKLFKNTYGNVLKQKKLSTPTLPKGFSANALTKDAKKNINSAYSSATSSNSFQYVKNSVSTSNIFKAAQNGSSSYNLDFSGDSSSAKKKIQSEYDNSGKSQYDSIKKKLSNQYKNANISEDASGNYLGGIPKTIKKGVDKIKKHINKNNKGESGGSHY